MKAVLFCLVVCFVLNSCSIFKSGNYDSRETEIILLKQTDYQNDKLIFINSKNEFELFIPLSKIYKYTNAYDKDKLQIYINKLSELDSNKILDTKFSNEKQNTYKYQIELNDLFESGEYLIFDNKNNKYIEKVIAKWESGYNGPLAAGYYYSILIDDFIFYEIGDDA